MSHRELEEFTCEPAAVCKKKMQKADLLGPR